VAAAEQGSWLGDWALYSALKSRHRDVSWTDWPAELRDREPAALANAARALGDDLAYHRFVQFVFARQWDELRAQAHRLDVSILGDLPIYVAHDSADVWSRRELFQLDAAGRPKVVAGVPPDYFSPTGQRWGNPLYDWAQHAADGYRWWCERLRGNLARTDWVRLDHFRGFAAYWEVPAEEETAERGRWVEGPGLALFEALRGALGEDLPLVAEDLGVITEEVDALREQLGLPGMKVLQFAFGEDDSPHAPHRHVARAVVYSGTHDNDTTAGWYAALGAAERRSVDDYLGSGEPIAVRMVRAALTSVADLAVLPLQDLLGLGSEARMNTPGEPAADWAWRTRKEAWTEELAAALLRVVRQTGRLRDQDAG
jgi:4-alpha-glucanotransferase